MDFSVFPAKKYLQAVTLGNSLEAIYVEKFFYGRSQDEITFEQLKLNYNHDSSACLSFMLPEAFAFFLPAYMRIALEDYDKSDAIPDGVIYDLLEIAKGNDQERLSAILSSYSRVQLKAVATFLHEMSKKYWHLYPSDDAKKAFDIYWYEFST